jgi:hypothetical protein
MAGASWNSTSTCVCSTRAARTAAGTSSASRRPRPRPAHGRRAGDARGVLDDDVLGDDELLEAGGDGRRAAIGVQQERSRVARIRRSLIIRPCGVR